ncbi:hypothetical protein A8L34_28165 [Bacillus sp. FJAT-27264]|uniref:hypothetical protein n=1 Tax=Paenibacillus sp. (strain DSM 101736 / FJAT-27264) TaxID=1850362 RepID=UPI000807B9A4|nr:hypothetical protein [Bacillus sp. FJAT-27264]OBZ15924.1 hypothetical protein A8L34_28165 [Bacillus sp. FJAT-27264]
MRRIYGYFLIFSPAWLLVVMIVPGVLVQLLKGRSWDILTAPITNIISFLFFTTDLNGRILESVIWWIRVVYWAVVLILITVGCLKVRRKRPAGLAG